jgi:SAM-dependent methyltransferase
VKLPNASIDVALVSDTYHHFEYPVSMLSSLYDALRSGGQLAVIDFERIPGVSRKWVLDHVRVGKKVVVAEIEAAGFELVEEIPVSGLVENYMLRFQRPPTGQFDANQAAASSPPFPATARNRRWSAP